MFNPFFDPSPLSNKELMEKINDISVRISSARSAGIEYDLIKSMYALIASCEEELRTRDAQNEMKSAKKDSPVVFDTDTYLNQGDKKKNESSRKQNYKPGW